jgi:hypothetical protein
VVNDCYPVTLLSVCKRALYERVCAYEVYLENSNEFHSQKCDFNAKSFHMTYAKDGRLIGAPS